MAEIEPPKGPASFQNGRYSVIKKLGEGGKGIVYKCMDNSLNRIVALKLIKGSVQDSDFFARIKRESQTTARLSHPNIVAIYDINSEGKNFYLVMEFVDGSGLDSIISRNQTGMKLSEFMGYSIEISKALNYAHSMGVLHRDIKPENIMITKEGVPKLTDFGLAKSMDSPSLTSQGTIIGTPAYISPESALTKESDARSDLYSLGCVMYEMVTGVKPFQSNDTLKLVYSQIHDVPKAASKVNPSIPASLEAVIMKLLRKNPDERFQSSSELLEALKSIQPVINNLKAKNETTGERQATPQRSSSSSSLSRRMMGLVGRESEIEFLETLVNSIKISEGRMAMLMGSSGVGKTRLVEELRNYSALQDVRVMSVRCREDRKNVPNYLLSDLLREYLYLAPPQEIYKIFGDYIDLAFKLVPELSSRIDETSQNTRFSSEDARLRFFDGTLEIIKNISKEGAIVCVFEDVQYADESSLAVLDHLSEFLNNLPVLILLTSSEPAEDSFLSDIIGKLSRDKLMEVLRIVNLDKDNTASMIAGFVGANRNQISNKLVDFVYSKAGGNPFFIEEILKLMIENKNVFRMDDGRWDITQVEEIEVPSSIRSMIKSKTKNLEENAKNLLGVASIIGEEFDIEVLQRASGIENEDSFFDLLEKLLKEKIILEVKGRLGHSLMGFSDPQIRSYFYTELSMIMKKRYHLRVAEILEKKYGQEKQDLYSEISSHYLEGGNYTKALIFKIKHANHWIESYGYDKALNEFLEVLDIFEMIPSDSAEIDRERVKAELFEKIGFCYSKLGNESENYSFSVKAANLYGKLGDILPQIRCLRYALLGLRGTTSIPETILNFVNNFSYSSNNVSEFVKLLGALGNTYWYIGDFKNAREILERAITIGNENGVQHLFSEKLILSYVTEIKGKKDLDNYEKLMRTIIKEAMAVEEELSRELFDVVIAAHNYLANFYVDFKKDFNLSENEFNKCYELSRKYNSKLYYWYNKAEEVYFILIHKGLWNQAITNIAQISKEKVASFSHISAYLKLSEGIITGERGDSDRAMEMLKTIEEKGGLQFKSYSYPEICLIYMHNGRLDEALSTLDKSYRELKEIGVYDESLPGLIKLASIGVELNSKRSDLKNAEYYLEELQKYTEIVSEEWMDAVYSRAKSLILAMKGIFTEAIDLLNKSCKTFESIGLRFELGISLLLMAELYRKQNDLKNTNDSLNNSMEIFNDLGCAPLAEVALGLKNILKA